MTRSNVIVGGQCRRCYFLLLVVVVVVVVVGVNCGGTASERFMDLGHHSPRVPPGKHSIPTVHNGMFSMLMLANAIEDRAKSWKCRHDPPDFAQWLAFVPSLQRDKTDGAAFDVDLLPSEVPG